MWVLFGLYLVGLVIILVSILINSSSLSVGLMLGGSLLLTLAVVFMARKKFGGILSPIFLGFGMALLITGIAWGATDYAPYWGYGTALLGLFATGFGGYWLFHVQNFTVIINDGQPLGFWDRIRLYDHPDQLEDLVREKFPNEEGEPYRAVNQKFKKIQEFQSGEKYEIALLEIGSTQSEQYDEDLPGAARNSPPLPNKPNERDDNFTTRSNVTDATGDDQGIRVKYEEDDLDSRFEF